MFGLFLQYLFVTKMY